MFRIVCLCTLALGCAAARAQGPTPEPAPTPAPASTPAPSDLRKFYLGLTLGRSKGVDEDPQFEDDSSLGYTAGMRLDGRWAVELFERKFALAADFAEAIIGSDGNSVPTHISAWRASTVCR